MTPVTRRAKVSRATRRADIQRRLLIATEHLLASGASFTEISVEQLITEAQIARSTFYAYFEDKGVLLLELTDQVTQELEVAASHWYRLPSTATKADLRDAIGQLMDSYVKHRLMLVAVQEAAAYDPRVREQFDAVMARRFSEMADGFRSQQLEGGVRADVDVASVTPWIGWMTERGLYQLLGHGPESISEHLDGMTTVIWHVLYEGTRG